MPRKKSTPVDVGLNRVVLEPFTKIAHFGGISWEVPKVVNGAIGALLFGDDREQKRAFSKGPTGRRNAKVVMGLVSQVYSYLDGTISEFADIDDYVFRVYARVTVDKTDGSIVADPLFSVEIFKHFARISAKGTESEESVNVAFLGIAGEQFIGPGLVKVLSKAVKEFKAIKFVPYSDVNLASPGLRKLAVKNSPTLVVGDAAFPVKLKTMEDGTNYIYIEDEGNEVRIKSEKDLVVFLSKKSGLKPEIFSDTTVFDSTDKMQREIKDITDRITENFSEETKEEDLLKSMGLDAVIESLEQSLDSVKKGEKPESLPDEVTDAEKELADAKKEYTSLKVDYESANTQLKDLGKMLGKQITTEQYTVERWKMLRTKGMTKEALIKLQTRIKGSLRTEVDGMIARLKSTAQAK